MGSITESSKKHPIDEQLLIPPEFSKFGNEIPPSHTWSDLCMIDPTLSNRPFPSSIPVINLSDPHSPELIKRACEEWGVFQITNHGVPMQLIADMEAEARQLFSLPLEQKVRALRSLDGMTGYGQARMSPFHPKRFWFEGFATIGSPREYALRIWPSDSDRHARMKFCDVLEEYQETLKGLAERLLGLRFSSLGLSSKQMEWLAPKDGQKRCGPPQTVLQLNSYPVCPDPTHAMGMGPHTDSSILSIVRQANNVLGLQVQYNGQWVPVPPIDGAFVIHVGDLLRIFTNGWFKTLLHRAVVNNSSHRYSVAYFYGTPKDVTISTSEKLITHDHPRLYRPITWKEYLEMRGADLYGALETLRLDPLGSSSK
ncbi:hypothetical protein Ancab_035333 [Ancistrocladus abbreviatus]